MLLVLAAGGAAAQIAPDGDEFQVNTYTPSNQERPGIAAAAAGGFVVAWQSFGSGGSDSQGWSVQAQRFDPAGAPSGAEFQVNTYTSADQWYPAVGSSAAGEFVVTWRSLGSYGSDTLDDSVQAQLHDENGVPAGGQFQVNTYTTNHQRRSAVAFDGLGNFVVVWGGGGSFGSDTSYSSVLGQRFDPNGNPLSGEFQVNTYTTSYQRLADVAADAAGNFVVVWESIGSSGTDSSATSIQAQRYDANGDPQGTEFQVNTYTTNGQWNPAVAMDPQGNFVVAWWSFGSFGSDASGPSTQAQRYSSSGFPLGGEFQVNTYTTGTQGFPAVATDAAGSFVVAWRSAGSSGSDTSGYSIQARHFAADGTPLGSELQVNTYTTSQQDLAAVAADGQGRFVVAWQSIGSSGTDTSGPSIQARRLAAAFFGDGFETGSTGRWSGAVP